MRYWAIETLLQSFDLDFTIEGKKNKPVKDISSLDKGTSKDLSFCANEGYRAALSISKSNSGIILCKKNMEGFVHPKNRNTQALVFVENPRLVFTKIAKKIKQKRQKTGVSSLASVSDSARIGDNCYIGDFTVIGDNCVIGDNTIVDARVTLQNCYIGKDCAIQSGTTIGSDGFAFEREDVTLDLEKFPHYGRVIINDNVEVFANCSIARGSLSDTVIGPGTKIDALCHIAHNVCIGKNTELTAGTIIGGSTNIGDSCWLGLNSTVKNKVRIGDNVIVGSGSSVIHDVGAGDIVAGVPAKSIKYKVNADKYKLFLMAGQKKGH